MEYNYLNFMRFVAGERRGLEPHFSRAIFVIGQGIPGNPLRYGRTERIKNYFVTQMAVLFGGFLPPYKPPGRVIFWNNSKEKNNLFKRFNKTTIGTSMSGDDS